MQGPFSLNVDRSMFTFADRGILSFQYSCSSLPISHATTQQQISTYGYLPSTCKYNVAKTQKELLMSYAVLGHYDIVNT